MITATIRTKKKVKGVLTEKREMRCFNGTEKARKFLEPIATNMAVCRARHIEPDVEIVGVSYDLESEKRMLLEIKAVISVENESPDGY